MKVLFVHDIANVSRDLGKELEKLDVETHFAESPALLGLIREIRHFQADVIHANYIRSPAYAALLSGKRPYVLEAHGDDVRHGLNPLKKLAIKYASKVFYSTPELHDSLPRATYLPRPIDLSRFHPIKYTTERKAVYFEQSTGDERSRKNETNHIVGLLDFCEENGYELTIKTKRGIAYSDMPEYLSQFSLFFDHAWPIHSKTALEAMAMKIPVMPEKGIPQDDQYEFALRHDSRIVARLLKAEYESL